MKKIYNIKYIYILHLTISIALSLLIIDKQYKQEEFIRETLSKEEFVEPEVSQPLTLEQFCNTIDFIDKQCDLYVSKNNINSIINVDTLFTILAYIETRNDSTSIGDSGKAFGILQIHDVAVQHINMYYQLDYKHKDMFNTKVSYEAMLLYLNIGIVRFKDRYNQLPTPVQVAKMWNGGHTGYRRLTTLSYGKKFNKALIANF